MSNHLVLRRVLPYLQKIPSSSNSSSTFCSPSSPSIFSSLQSSSSSTTSLNKTYGIQQVRFFATLNVLEERIRGILEKALQPTALQVVVDGDGCEGGFATVIIESAAFKGKSMLASHRLINQLLSDEIKGIHGIRVQTSTPPEPSSS